MRPIDADAFATWVNMKVPADTPELLISKSMVMAGLKTKSVTPTIEVAKNINVYDKWISVKDELPKKNDIYLVYDGDIVYSAEYQKGRTVSEWTDDYEGYLDLKVTHWMYLPEPPKGDD